jgi:flagellar basal body rod protein FlgC
VSDFDILGAAASGMEAQRAAMDVEARNVAIAQTGDVHHPAYGLVPQFSSVLASRDSDADMSAFEARMDDVPDGPDEASGDEQGGVVAFTGVRRGSLPIDSIGEMVNVLDAQRAYEADASTFDVGKRLFQRTIEMGRL